MVETECDRCKNLTIHFGSTCTSRILTEKFGSFPIITTSLIGSSVISLLIPFLASHWMILLQVLLGAFQPGFQPAAYTCFRLWVPLNERTFATGLIIFCSSAEFVMFFSAGTGERYGGQIFSSFHQHCLSRLDFCFPSLWRVTHLIIVLLSWTSC